MLDLQGVLVISGEKTLAWPGGMRAIDLLFEIFMYVESTRSAFRSNVMTSSLFALIL